MTSSMLRSLLLAGTASGLLTIASPAAARAEEPVAADEAGSAGSNDIIVTARRRQESILKVPVIENVITSEVIERAQIKDLTDLSKRVPGLNIGTGPLTIGPQISLRGIGTQALDQGIDQSVSLNIDGLSLTQGLAYTAGVFDLAQAEVLKGPQALFFGKNSPGGVVSLRSNDPGDSLELIARAGYEFEAEEKRGELIVSSPLSDTFGVRLAGMASFQNGFFRNRAQNLTAAARGARTPDLKFADSKSFIVRGTALWKPTTDFSARLKVNYTYTDTEGDAAQGQRVSCPDGNRPAPATGIIFQNPNDDCTLDRNTYLVWLDPAAFPNARNSGEPFIKQQQVFGTLELNYRTDSKINLTSITGYYDLQSDSLINAILTGFSAPYYGADNHFYRHDFTQEFRVDTDFSGPLNFTAGAFYQKGAVSNRLQLPINRALLPAPAFPTGYLATGRHRMSIEAYSVFGQLRYKIVPTVELAAGVRWSHERRSDFVQSNVYPGSTPVDISLPNRNEFSTSKFSPEATITWTPTDDFTLFAAAKQGYKSGSFTLVTPAPNPHFGDERIRGGEIGIKSRLADRQLFLNLAGYYYTYKGLQVNLSFTLPNGPPLIVTQNAGGARIYGVDFDFTYRPASIEGLSITGAVNWNHSRFTDFKNATCINGQTIAQGCNRLQAASGLYTAQDLTGQPLPRAADWQMNMAVDYEMPAGDNNVVRMGVAGQYSSRYIRTLGLDPSYYQKPYAMLDANLAYAAKDDGWEIALIGRNLTNKITAGSCTASSFEEGGLFGQQITGGPTAGPAGMSEFSCIARRGRELWVRLSFKR